MREASEVVKIEDNQQLEREAARAEMLRHIWTVVAAVILSVLMLVAAG